MSVYFNFDIIDSEMFILFITSNCSFKSFW